LDFYPVKESMQPSFSTKEKPSGLDLNNFFPNRKSLSSSNGLEISQEISKAHIEMCNILSLRNTNLKLIRNIWARGEVREALETMGRMNDPAVVVDILNVMGDKTNIFTLDMCVILLPLFK